MSSTAASRLMDLTCLENLKEEFVPLLIKVCSDHPSLIESYKADSPQIATQAFASLGEVIHFLKTRKVKDMMTPSACEELERLYNDLKLFKFDLTWLDPRVKAAVDWRKHQKERNASLTEIKRLEEKLVAAKDELRKIEESPLG